MRQQFDDLPMLIQKNQINRISHAHRVHQIARLNQQPFTGQ